MKTIKVNNITFTVNKKALDAHMTGKHLYDCYGSPSYAKVSAYDEWIHKWNDISKKGDSWFGVQSYNTFQFTLGFTFHNGMQKYKAFITNCNNYAYPID